MDETISAKKQKRAELEAQGIVVHPYTFNKTHSIQAAREAMNEEVQSAGRIMSKRSHGKVTFFTLQDHTAQIQLMIKEEDVGAIWYQRLSLIDASDYLGIRGKVITSKTGEITIQVTSIEILSKALRSVPSTWQGLEDKEVRFRKRYLDLLINPETKKVLDARWIIEKEVRRYLEDVHQFIEVETPILQPLYGGTNAKPFMTHMNALDSDFYLRIAPELYLKRLIIGGYERIFEIARNFRNEGIDLTHQPEFTMIEWYHAYADYTVMMDVAEGLFKHLAQKLYGNLSLFVQEGQIDLTGRWPRISMKEALKQYASLDVDSMDDNELQAQLQKNAIEGTGTFRRGKAIFSLFDHLVTKQLLNPTWIIDYPKEVSPLAKQHRSTSSLVERFELYIGGKEMADGWSEITDAIEQRSRFESEQKNMREGDDEAQPTDEDFLEAMEYGMPPLGGIGIGIDRLVMFLTNTWAIRETIAFPTLRPTEEQVRMSHLMHPQKETPPTQKVFTSAIDAIDPQVQRDFPGIFFAYVTIRGVKISQTNTDLEKQKQVTCETKENMTTDDISSLLPIQAYRSLLKATGTDWHSKRPSPEALLRRLAQHKGLYMINTAVDAYNIAVIETGIGLGGFDLAALQTPIVLRYSRAGEIIHLLGDSKATILRDNQLIYSDTNQPITTDVNYRDANATKITEETTDILLCADGAPNISQQEVLNALQRGAELIVTYCGGTIGTTHIIV